MTGLPFPHLPRRAAAATSMLAMLAMLAACGGNRHDDNGVMASTTNITPASLALTAGARFNIVVISISTPSLKK